MSVYRLQAERAGAGPHLFPRPFATVEAACEFAERNLDQLADHFGWRVRSFRVLELPSLRVVTTITWHDPTYDPDPFAPGGAHGSTVAADPARHGDGRVVNHIDRYRQLGLRSVTVTCTCGWVRETFTTRGAARRAWVAHVDSEAHGLRRDPRARDARRERRACAGTSEEAVRRPWDRSEAGS